MSTRKLNYKSIINFEDRDALTDAFNKGEITTDHIYHILNSGVHYRLDFGGKGFVEISDPSDPSNDTIFIWWVDQYHVMAALYQMEQGDNGQATYPPLPGHIRMALTSIRRGTAWDGHLIVPVTLRNLVDPNHVDDVQDSQCLKGVLYSKFVGIPFEMVHYDKIKHYAGIITTLDLGQPDLCWLREKLQEGISQ